MQFLPLRTFQQQFPAISFPLAIGAEQELRDAVYQVEAWKQSDLLTKETFIHHCLNEKNVLFLSWVDQMNTLYRLLTEGVFVDLFKDESKVLSHLLAREFQQFLSPFLLPVLQQNSNDFDFEKIQKVLSFTQLLPDRDADIIQGNAANWMSDLRRSFIAKCENCKSDQELYQVFKTELPPSFWNCFSFFNPRFYRVSTSWLEELLKLAYHPKSSRRLVLFIVEELKQLQLTPAHQKELNSVGEQLKSGAFVFEKTRYPWLRLVAALVVGIMAFGIMVGIWWIPDTTVEEKVQEETSFMAFTSEERKHLDSLISAAQVPQETESAPQIDTDLLETPAELVHRKPWKNETFTRIYDAWMNNDSTPTTTVFSQSEVTFKNIPGTRYIRTKNGSIPTAIHNNTGISLLVLIFQNEKGKPVYSKFIQAQSLSTFKLAVGDHLVVVPGNKVPNELKEGQIPFKEVDFRFFENLQKAYRVKAYGPKSIDLVWETLSSKEMYLVDMNNALELP